MSTTPLAETDLDRETAYVEATKRINALLDGEDDWIAAMATVASELHQSFDHYDWTGFYRVVGDRTLVIGPYQGSHGCLRISFDRGVCGAAARERATQLVPDVDAFPDHIACSSSTKSEIVVPIVASDGRLIAVLDVDSNTPDAFNEIDRIHLEQICGSLGAQFTDAGSGG